MTPENFNKYKIGWAVFREKYRKENQELGSSRYVIAGNSLVHLFQPWLMKKELPGIDIANRGIGGDMTELLLLRLQDTVLSLKPETVIFEIGGNDLIAGKCLGLIQQNILRIIQTVHGTNPATRMIFISTPPTSVVELNEIVPVYNLFLQSMAQKFSNVQYVDIWSDLRDGDSPSIQQQYRIPGDNIHFNEKGYAVMARRLRPLLQQGK